MKSHNKTNIFDLGEKYMIHIAQIHFQYDEVQYEIAKKIGNLISGFLNSKKNFLSKANYLLYTVLKAKQKYKNIFYLYGSVGSGKSFLTNLILKLFPSQENEKVRLNFYQFIDNLRSNINLNISTTRSGSLNEMIKKQFENIKLLCIDEFHVLDISDAMMIKEFFLAAISMKDMIVIINSNREPSELYKNGIHVERFLPVIEIIEKESYVMNLSTHDYRSQYEDILKYYFLKSNDIDIFEIFNKNLKNKDSVKKIDYTILSQKINFYIIEHSEYNNQIFIEFNEFFTKPLYAKNYHNFLLHFKVKKIYINNIPILDGLDNEVKRFISFIDTIYEMSIRAVISASSIPEELYRKGKLVFEFERTISRIRMLSR